VGWEARNPALVVHLLIDVSLDVAEVTLLAGQPPEFLHREHYVPGLPTEVVVCPCQ